MKRPLLISLDVDFQEESEAQKDDRGSSEHLEDAFLVPKRMRLRLHIPTDAMSSWKRLDQLHIENNKNVLPPSQQESRQASFCQFGSFYFASLVPLGRNYISGLGPVP